MMTAHVFRPYSVERVRRSLSDFVLGKSLGMLIGVGLLLTLVRVLSIEDYAFYVATLALLEIVAQFSSFGLYPAAQRYLPEYLYKGEGHMVSRFTFFLCIGRLTTLLLALAILFPLASFLAPVLGLEKLGQPLQLFLLVILLEGFARFLDVIFESLLLQRAAQISLLLRGGIRVTAAAGFLLTEGMMSLQTWIYIDAIAALIACAFAVEQLRRFTQGIARVHPGAHAKLNLRRYLRYSAPSYLAASLYTATGPNVGTLIAARILSVTHFAAFGFAMSLASMLQRYLPMFLLIGMVRPLFVAAGQRGDSAQRLSLLAAVVLKLNVFALVPAAAFFSVSGQALVDIVTSGRFPEVGGYLVGLVVVLLLTSCQGVVTLVARAVEDARAPLIGTVFGLVGLIAGVTLSTVLGAYGLIAGLAASELILSFWVSRALRRRGIFLSFWSRHYVRFVINGALTGGVMWAATELFDPSDLGGVIGIAATGFAFYALISYLIKPFNQDERDLINGLFRRKVFVW